uniref:Uncharacterized protein n=1 Tax=Rhizophora mucronata TaxID=61149 RepID=A0A2P2NCN5_RHIMU
MHSCAYFSRRHNIYDIVPLFYLHRGFLC